MRIAMEDAVRWMEAEGTAEGYATGWSIDSRTVEPGDVFFAIRGGRDFIPEAIAKGAIAVTEQRASGSGMLRVDDPVLAMQRLAKHARQFWGGKIVGVTGSAGKTTTKDVIAHFLSTAIPTGKTVGNFNNDIGLPLSILRLPDSCRVGVLEMGMNHAGEIRDLCAIAKPDVGVVTNVGYAHIEFFESIEGIALAKRELVDSLPSDGIAILNADDSLVAEFSCAYRGRSILYGFGEGADVRGTGFEGTSFRCDGVVFETPLSGMHGALNVLAGIATARAFGINTEDLVDAARTIPVGKMRGERLLYNGVTVLNDAYNSNPDAVYAMLDVLASTQAHKHVAVLGEMLELGAQSDKLHRSVGAYAVQKEIDVLIGIRGSARAMLDEAARAGMASSSIFFFEDPVDAGVKLRSLLKPGDAVLFKGSRGVRVERALEKLMEAAA